MFEILAKNNPGILAVIILFTAYLMVYATIAIAKYVIRGRNIRKYGWPPTHCDADGVLKDDCGCQEEED